MKKFLCLAVLALLWAAPATATAETVWDDEGNRTNLVSLVNQFREQHGLNRLIISPALSRSAQAYAEFLYNTNQNDHNIGQDTDERAISHGWQGYGVAENLTRSHGAHDAFHSWADEPFVAAPEYNHHTLMIEPGLTHIGVGVIFNRYVLNMGWCREGCEGTDSGPLVPTPPVVVAPMSPRLAIRDITVRKLQLDITITTERFANGELKVVLTGPRKFKKKLSDTTTRYNKNKYRVTVPAKGRYSLSVSYQGDDEEWTSERLSNRAIRVR